MAATCGSLTKQGEQLQEVVAFFKMEAKPSRQAVTIKSGKNGNTSLSKQIACTVPELV
jgi:hypothetical protein